MIMQFILGSVTVGERIYEQQGRTKDALNNGDACVDHVNSSIVDTSANHCDQSSETVITF